VYNHAGRSNAPAPKISEAGPVAADLKAGEVFISANLVNGLGSAELVDMIRETVRQTVRDELSVVLGTACPSHTTAVKDGTWDAGANEGHLPSPVPLATVKKMYAYYDEDKVEDGGVPKSAAKLPHHFVGADGTPGAASVAGVRNALARLPQTEGLSDAERSAAEAHLRAHLNAFNDSEDEGHTHEGVDDEHSHEDVDDASKKPFPPKQDEPEEEPDTEPDEDDDDTDNKSDVTDDWSGFVAQLTTPSPSADDVFNTLKEGW
jgi:hypothetical protein